jgi:hypothetical protein
MTNLPKKTGKSGVGSHNWWLAMSTGAEEFPLLEAITKQ